ncbi:MAG: hypothetical protein QNJ47_26785 [Nostocaceae cyanobacterium]|nr:hypothetical protein [Nostocaceae cyanobacterium]
MGVKMRSLIPKLIISSLLAVSWITPVQAQRDLLTRAEVYKLLNQVVLLLREKQPRAAKKADILKPLDALQTKTKSRAELLFNEGSLARIGSNAIFRFKPGLRRFELPSGVRAETIFELRNGIAVVLNPPGSSGTTVETPQTKIEFLASTAIETATEADILALSSKSSAIAIVHDGGRNTTQAFNLTRQAIKISNLDGTQFKILQAGETVSVKNGVIGEIQTFNLDKFYKTTQLATGLGPGQEALVTQESPRVQQILNAVRKETIAAWESQRLWIQGLCTLNSRGSSSTLSTNCITTNADDPVTNFEERRDVVTPEPEVPEPEVPEPEVPEPEVPEPEVPEPENPEPEVPEPEVPEPNGGGGEIPGENGDNEIPNIE